MSERRFEHEPFPPVGVPLAIEVLGEEVVFIGPGRVAFSMTREAAAETCRRLSEILKLS